MNENNQKRHWDVEAENDEGEFYTVLSQITFEFVANNTLNSFNSNFSNLI
jgi:hypothetical protein